MSSSGSLGAPLRTWPLCSRAFSRYAAPPHSTVQYSKYFTVHSQFSCTGLDSSSALGYSEYSCSLGRFQGTP